MVRKEIVMKKLFLFTVLISALTLGAYWGGQRLCMRMAFPGNAKLGPNWYAELGLNKSETEIFKKQDSAFRQETNRVCMELCRQRMQLLDLLTQNADENQVYQKLDEINVLQAALEKNIVKHMLEVKKQLPAEKGAAYMAHLRQQLEKSITQCIHEK